MRLLLGIFALIGILFVGVLIDLQTSRAGRLRDLGESQRSAFRSLAGYRGSILDRDGFVLASSTPALQLVADPQLVEDPEQTAAVLAPALGVDAASLIAPLTPSSADDRYGLLAKSLDDQAVGLLSELFDDERHDEILAGVALTPAEDRIYPAGTLARPVVGAVDPYEEGLFGIEWQFEQYLEGRAGLEQFERGVFGRITGGEWSVEPAVPGSDVVLTIDHRIQYVVEQALIEHCTDMGARAANAVVSDPRTGEILAMGTVLRDETGRCYVPMYNAPLVDTFEPGSVLKLVTVAAALNEFGYTGDTTIPVPPRLMVGDKLFEDHPEHAAADFPISQIVADSMNVGMIKLAQQVGPERLHDYLVAFGFGDESGIGFKDEATGTVREIWHGSDQGSIPIGQGITANAVQLMSAYNAIANDGVYVAPKLVRAVVAPDGTRRLPEPQEARPIVSPATADEVTRMLTGVVSGGTGTAASVPGYSVAGKTGTAWKVHRNGRHQGTYGVDGDRRYIVTFAGFLPAENPELSIIVVVDEPTVENTAGKVAAPVFADIAHYALRILGIPPAAVDTEMDGPVRGVPAGVDEDDLAAATRDTGDEDQRAPGTTADGEAGRDEEGGDADGSEDSGGVAEADG